VRYETINKGERRTFTITIGLSEGYGDKAIVHHPNTADRVANDWMEARAKEKLLTISGFFTEIELHYMYDEDGRAQSKHEPGVRFWGEVSIRRLHTATDEMIVETLNDLADSLGLALGQKQVTLSYRDSTWTRELQPE
jgi:hypothetical protein